MCSVIPLWREKKFSGDTVYTDNIFITILSLFKIGFMKPIFLYISPASLSVCSSLSLHSLCPSSEGEESRRFIKAIVRGGGQEETSLASLLPAHPRPLTGWPRRRGHRPCPPSSPPSPPRPLRFLSDGIAGAGRLLSDRE